MLSFDPREIESPSFVCDLGLLERNLKILGGVQDRTGAKILLALKGFALFSAAPLIMSYLKGIAASSVDEARLGREEFKGEVHAYAPAYSEAHIAELLTLADHIVFNSAEQWARFKDQVLRAGNVEAGIRVNPEHSEVHVEMYDPCARRSRLGTTAEALLKTDLSGIQGLHFHALCQSNADALERTLSVFEDKCKSVLRSMKWINFGGGHHITRADYNVPLLERLIQNFQQKHQVQVYLEPGEAVALNTGYLVAEVLDIIDNGGKIALLDTSANAHMPDVIEMPYRPEILGAFEPEQAAHRYRLGGLTCLAGDIIGDYSFAEPLQIGDRLVFTDMAHYSMVKTTTFNGVRLPSITLAGPKAGELRVIRRFGYADYKSRLS